MNEYVYEVSIRLDTKLTDAYMVWLKDHVAEMLKLPCFQTAQIYRGEEGSKNLIRVHYGYQEPIDFQTYLDRYAEKMRGQLPEIFKNQLEFERVLLKKVHHE